MKITKLVTIHADDTGRNYAWLDDKPQQEQTPDLYECQISVKRIDPGSSLQYLTFQPLASVIIERGSIERSGYWIGYKEQQARAEKEKAGERLPTIEDLMQQILAMIGIEPKE